MKTFACILVTLLAACGHTSIDSFLVVKCNSLELQVDKNWQIVSGLDKAVRICNSYVDKTGNTVNVPFHGIYSNTASAVCDAVIGCKWPGFMVIDNGLISLDNSDFDLTNGTFFSCQ